MPPSEHAHQNWGLAPEFFQVVIGAHFGIEQVDDDIAVIYQHPAILSAPLDAQRYKPFDLFDFFSDIVHDRVKLAIAVGLAYHEEVGDGRYRAQITQDDLFALFVRNQIDNVPRQINYLYFQIVQGLPPSEAACEYLFGLL